MTETRDFVGYGANPPNPNWPGNARIALQFVLNYEEGGERSVANGDGESESILHEQPGTLPRLNARNLQVESVYEYGSRVGFWRLMRLFDDYAFRVSVFAVGMALERNPEAARLIVTGGHEIVSHGWRWIDYQNVEEGVERDHIHRAISSIQHLTGSRPVGWYTGRCGPNTRRLIIEEGGFLYDSDAYSDDLPYWINMSGKPHLIVPYTFDNNDAKFYAAPGFGTGEDFFNYLKDSFDTLYAEGSTEPKMMSVGLHGRISGRPGRFASLARFLDHVLKHERVWVCRRVDIAQHWHKNHPYTAQE